MYIPFCDILILNKGYGGYEDVYGIARNQF